MPILFIGIAAAIYGFLSLILPERLRRRSLAGRDSIPFAAIYQSNFSHLKLSVRDLETHWCDLAAALGVDPGKLRPTDRFGKELSVSWFPFADLNEKASAFLREKIGRHEMDKAKLDTVGEYIEAISTGRK